MGTKTGDVPIELIQNIDSSQSHLGSKYDDFVGVVTAANPTDNFIVFSN